jgi:hypothetical protein
MFGIGEGDFRDVKSGAGNRKPVYVDRRTHVTWFSGIIFGICLVKELGQAWAPNELYVVRISRLFYFATHGVVRSLLLSRVRRRYHSSQT